jgi:uridylate kinase
MRFSRVLLKLSGEAIKGSDEAFARDRLLALTHAIGQVVAAGVQLGIVLGAGNIFRARSANLSHVDRVTADQVGMLGTVMNAAVLRDYLRAEGLNTSIFSPRELVPLTRPFSRDVALPLLKAGHVVLFAGGTGNPFFTTDTAAALRACEISADVLLKGTQVDGVYAQDPRQNPGATRFDHLTFDEVISRRLGVMDLTAITLCRERDLPVLVFDVSDPENLLRVVQGEKLGTWITRETEP